MWMQTVNRADTERVWVNFTNIDGQTITAHAPVNKILYTAARSVSIQENSAVSTPANSNITGGIPGNFIGVAYEDVADGAVGIAQVYGYHESILIAPVAAAVTIRTGQAMVPDSTTIGFNSVGAALVNYAVVALDTVAGGQASGNGAMLSAGIAGAGGYADNVFIRAM